MEIEPGEPVMDMPQYLFVRSVPIEPAEYAMAEYDEGRHASPPNCLGFRKPEDIVKQVHV